MKKLILIIFPVDVQDHLQVTDDEQLNSLSIGNPKVTK